MKISTAASSLLLLLASASLADPSSIVDTSRELWESWGNEHFVETPAPCLSPAALVENLVQLQARYPQGVKVEEIGRSVQGRPIHLLTVGHGSRKVLLWSQMHGDEPSATPALVDIAAYLMSHRGESSTDEILSQLTLLMIPMLNPDGAEVYTRRNAQAIDVNRDALNLATPEGRMLKRLRDEHQPILGFNLHDQDRRRTAGETGVPAANALLAVAGDAENTLTPGRLLAKRACSAIAVALAPHRPGGLARYDETWSPRSFGDNVTAWGTPVVLIESGSILSGTPFSDLTRLNFVGILSALNQLATNRLTDFDPEIYQTLPENNLGPWTDVIVRGGKIFNPGVPEPYRADLAFDLLQSDQQLAGCSQDQRHPSRIVEVGDGRELVGGLTRDASGLILAPPLQAELSGWEARDWLAAPVRQTLMESGIGRLTWVVAAADVDRAAAWLHTEEPQDAKPTIAVTVQTEPTTRPLLALRQHPPNGSSPPRGSLGERLAPLLSGEVWNSLESASTSQIRDLLWPSDSDASPALRPGASASFLILSTGDGHETIDLETRLHSIWLDGQSQALDGDEESQP